jgi:hypothetical protein
MREEIRLVHLPDCHSTYVRAFDGYDATGVYYLRCFGCGAMAHEALKFKTTGYLGNLSSWPDLEHTPHEHESGLLDFPGGIYSSDYTFQRKPPERLPIIKAPVALAFDPRKSVTVNDSEGHEGISFHELWADAIARTLWLGHKPFLITSQYFRLQCIQHANHLRKYPDTLLGERVTFGFDGFSWSEFHHAIGAQLVPYLIHALDSEGLWPFMRLPNGSFLQWRYEPVQKAA